MPRLCINCLLAESPCRSHAPVTERRTVSAPVESTRPRAAADASLALHDLCEF